MVNDVYINNSDFSSIEEKLSSSFRPIIPDPHFRSQLESRLIRRSEITLDTRRKGMVLIVLTIGLFIGGFLYFLFRKLT
ncbi:MAG: hypothetical protein CL609_12505 [Anaerolineaceae bacterium]|nr:hypothetical protein [Anaerolineaceae bacterium]